MHEISQTVDTKQQTKAMAHRLGYAGLLPFAVGALTIWLQPAQFGPNFVGDVSLATLIYGALILSFMGGARWGAAVNAWASHRLVVAVLPALVAWLAVMPVGVIPGFSPSPTMRFTILFVAFIGLMMSELTSGEWERWYTGLRFKLSLAACGLLLVTIIGSRMAI